MKLIALFSAVMAAAVADVFEDISNSDGHWAALCESEEAATWAVEFTNSEVTIEQINDYCMENGYGGFRTATSGALSASLANLQFYGCWCHAGSDWRTGRGDPVDALDFTCRNVHHSYTCLAKEGCDKDMNWVQVPVWDFATSTLQLTCDYNRNYYADQADGECAVKACTIGAHLQASITDLFMGGNSINPSFTHIGSNFERQDFNSGALVEIPGTFSFENGCTARPGQRDVACCGEYPFRREVDVNRNECCRENGFEHIRGCGQCMEDLVFSQC